jgi:hypothetical protein
MEANIDDNYNFALLNIPEIFNLQKNITIPIYINNNNYIALIDTASSNTLISYNLICNEKLDYLIDSNFNGMLNTLANKKSKLNCCGRIWCTTINIEKNELYMSPIIINSNNLNLIESFPIILGLDFLLFNKIDIIFSENNLKIKDNKINFL